MLESVYQSHLIETLEDLFPGCVVLKNDTSYRQGIPDLTIFWGPYWAVLEVKARRGATIQPNQQYYIDMLNDMSFAAFIYPENEAEILHVLQQAFQPGRHPRFLER